jgi:hypothetical protein
MAESEIRNLRSDRGYTLVLKFYAALLWLAGAIFIGNKALIGGVLISLLTFLAAAFHASLAVVQLRKGTLCYRRLLKWTAIHPGEVVSSGVVWRPWIGYVRLSHFVFPWGRLYFVLDNSPGYASLRYLRGESVSQERTAEKPSAGEDRSRTLELAVVALAGFVLSSILQASLPHPRYRSILGPRFDGQELPMFLIARRFWELVFSLPGLIGLFVIYASLAICKRHGRGAWPYAFLAGIWLSYILFYWLT